MALGKELTDVSEGETLKKSPKRKPKPYYNR